MTLYTKSTTIPTFLRGARERSLPIHRLPGLDMPYYALREALRLYVTDCLMYQISDTEIDALIEMVTQRAPRADIGAYDLALKKHLADTTANIMFLLEMYREKRGGVFNDVRAA